jgi:hypothetical protein
MDPERVCAKPGCGTILGPGGGVDGLCIENALEAMLEATEARLDAENRVAAAVGGVERHLIQINTALVEVKRLLERQARN